MEKETGTESLNRQPEVTQLPNNTAENQMLAIQFQNACC
jgi:hypothetical protein